MSTLPVTMFGMRCGRILQHELDLGLVVEQALGEDLRHGDVHADELAGLVLEMPRRIGAAGADDEVAAVEHVAQLAVRVGGLRRRLAGRGMALAPASNGAARQSECSHFQKVPAFCMIGHCSPHVVVLHIVLRSQPFSTARVDD